MIGILALQGGVEEHRHSMSRCGAATRPVRRCEDLENICGMILPGGESTTITKLIISSGIGPSVRSLIDAGMPVWGTCAGSILLSRGGIWESADVEMQRNAYGPQRESRIRSGTIKGRLEKIPMVFIRAPRVVNISGDVEVLARADGDMVALRQRNVLLTTFHPELTSETYFADIFMGMVYSRTSQAASKG
ncbi:MAG: pyridoxal 5'-phosphate synthase glutaminase subunit PdxT [Deltaproteobacteria bacterium]|nr:pyridoxal 5'-phosphate synthase glutaminase subunit PdxT [Deltaproteobacteria bacterium]